MEVDHVFSKESHLGFLMNLQFLTLQFLTCYRIERSTHCVCSQPASTCHLATELQGFKLSIKTIMDQKNGIKYVFATS